MKKIIGTALLTLSLISCGGGGGAKNTEIHIDSQKENLQITYEGEKPETTYTVSGKFVSSYVEGLKVCTEENYCTKTDAYGNFTVKSSTPKPTLLFYAGGVELGKYTLKENRETITPFKLTDDPQAGDTLARVIHALGNDPNGTAERIDLGEITASVSPQVNSILTAIENREPFTITVNSKSGSYEVKVSFDSNKPQVLLCEGDNSCTLVNYREWLVLIYMAADNNLNNPPYNDFAQQDLEEISQVTYNPQVKLVVMADLKQEGGTIIAESNDETGKLETFQTPDEPDTGSGYTLRSFIKKYEDKYPASKVALIFWDHGDGWRSLRAAAVDQTNNSYLYMYKIVDALKELQGEGYKVNLIGFDECLMGMAEVFYDVGQFVDAVVASEALEPGAGWNYTILLGELVNNPSLNPYQLGKLVVDSYREAYANQSGKTMIVLSSQEIEQLTNAINGLYDELNSDTYADFQKARENSVIVPDNQNGSLYHVDLYSFANQLKNSYPKAEEIVSVIENAYKFSSDSQLKGISIYFPPNSTADSSYPCYLREKPNGQPSCFKDPNYYNPFAVNFWDDFLKKYYDYQLQLEE